MIITFEYPIASVFADIYTISMRKASNGMEVIISVPSLGDLKG